MNNLNVAKIQLNGGPYEINTETNLNQLLNKLKIQKTKVAVEVNGAAIEHLKNIGIKVFEDSFFNYNSNGKFDVIMAWGVIEHITDPSLFLDKVYSMLNPSGVFVSEVKTFILCNNSNCYFWYF